MAGPQGAPGQGAPAGNISGQLESCTPGFNFTGLLVHIPGRAFSVFTGAIGHFQMDNVPPGTYAVVVEGGAGTLASVTSITVADGPVALPQTIVISDVLGDPNNCGACGVFCAGACVGGSCQTTPCLNGCSGNGTCNLANGVCACFPGFSGPACAQGTTANNCNGVNCLAVHPSMTCDAGICVLQCSGAFKDCNGNPSDGCERNINTDANNCGSCGTACAAANGVPACAAGSCTIASCNAPFANCNGTPFDGCERNLNTDANNCGSCGTACVAANGVPACAAGSCTIASCHAGFANCNGSPFDGCERNLNTDFLNCGACNHACNAGQSCTSGVCTSVNEEWRQWQ